MLPCMCHSEYDTELIERFLHIDRSLVRNDTLGFNILYLLYLKEFSLPTSFFSFFDLFFFSISPVQFTIAHLFVSSIRSYTL